MHKDKYLEKQEELELGKIIYDYQQTGKYREEAQEAHDKLFSANMGIAKNLANQMFNQSGAYKHYELEDVLQDAYYGLSKAIWSYDPNKNVKVSTFAYWHIRKECSNGINRNRRVTISDRGMGEWNKISNTIKEIQEAQPELNDTEVLKLVEEITGYTAFEINNLNEIINFHYSLDRNILDTENEKTLGEVLVKQKENNLYTMEELKMLFPMLTTEDILDFDSEYNLLGYYAKGKRDRAKQLGITQKELLTRIEGVKEIMKRAI